LEKQIRQIITEGDTLKIKLLFFLILTFCIININSVLAATVSISSAYVNDKTVSVEGVVRDSAKNQQIVVMISDILSGDSYKDVRYFNQLDFQNIKSNNDSFSLKIDISDLLSENTVYVARVGGTDIANPAQMIITTYNDSVEVLLGDVNLDGNITASDAAITLQHVLFNLEYLQQKQIDAMKVTKSEIITSENAAQILAKVLDSMYIFPINQ
jgi:hypothetical protein